MSDENWLDHAERRKREALPTSGFNLVMIDTFEPPGEAAPVVIGHYETREEAEAALVAKTASHQRQIEDDMIRFYVYAVDS